MRTACLVSVFCWLIFACGVAEVDRMTAEATIGEFAYAAMRGAKTLPEELQDQVSIRDVAAEWGDTGFIYFVNPPPDSNASQLEIEIRGHKVKRFRYGLLHRDTWCTKDDLINEAKVGETIILNELQLGTNGIKILCALPHKVHDTATASNSFSMLRWEKNDTTALLLNNLPAARDRKLNILVRNSDADTGFSSYYYKLRRGRVDCHSDQSAYEKNNITTPLSATLSQRGWYTLCITSDYSQIRAYQWLHRPQPQPNPPRLLVSRNTVEFTLGDNRSAEISVWNNGGGSLVWEGILPSNEDRTDMSWQVYPPPQLALQTTQLLPTYAMPWLEMRGDNDWFTVANKDDFNPQILQAGELTSGAKQHLTFRLADADNNYASWWQGLNQKTYMPYQYTKVLRFTNLASRFSTEVALTLYIPEMQLLPATVTLTPNNTQQMVEVKNIGLGDLRWRLRALLPREKSGIYTVGVAHKGEDEEGRLHGDGLVMIAIDTPLPTTRTQQVFEFSYMGGTTLRLPVTFEP